MAHHLPYYFMTTVEILQIIREPLWIIECETPIPAGFPSPAEDYRSTHVDLNAILLPNPLCTYMARVKGTSMDGAPAHITDGALITVDCSIKPEPGHIVVAAVRPPRPKASCSSPRKMPPATALPRATGWK